MALFGVTLDLFSKMLIFAKLFTFLNLMKIMCTFLVWSCMLVVRAQKNNSLKINHDKNWKVFKVG